MRKNIFKYVLMGAAICGAFISCQTEDAHDALQGLYQAPVDVTVNSAEVTNTEKGEGLRTISVQFGSAEGVVVNIDLVSNKYYLQSTTYTKALAAPKNGNYTAASVDGKEVQSGSLILEECEGGYYVKTSVLFTAEQSYRLCGQVDLVFEPDPEPIRLTQVLSVNATNPGQLTLNLGSDGLTASANMYGDMDISGDGTYLALDIYSPDGKLHPGTYAASATGGVIGENQFGIGWDPGDIFGWGYEFTDWGTCVWTLEGGVPSAWKVTKGEITVDLKGSTYTISYVEPDVELKNAVWVVFTGAIDEVAVGGGEEEPDYIEISNFISAAVNNGTTLSLQLAGEGITGTPNAWGGVDLAGDGNYLKIDLYTADGTLAEGTYTPAENDAMGEGNFAKGYDVEMWGMQFYNWGTCWMTREGETETGVHIEDGTITVTKSGDDYVIALQSSAVNVRYTGPITL